MHLDACNRHHHLGEQIQLGFLGPPVKFMLPIINQAPHVTDIGSIRPWSIRRLVGPTRQSKPLLELRNIVIADVVSESVHVVSVINQLEVRGPGFQAATKQILKTRHRP